MKCDAKAGGIILAGTRSSDGKTAVTCALLAALVERGLPVQPFKVGPDFIDPGYHSKVAGRASRNLDVWMMGETGVLSEVRSQGAGRLSIVEGVMGLFDGMGVATDEGSTMAVARLLNWPVLLVLPGAKAGRSLAAALRGFLIEAGLDEAGLDRIAGVILNGVSGRTHAEYLREAIAPLKVPVYGAIPNCEELSWPERYLGLQAIQERPYAERRDLAVLAEKYLDLGSILDLIEPSPPALQENPRYPLRNRIAVARDEAFHFYYEANFDYLRNSGSELVEFSPVHDTRLPSGIHGLLIGGGFPERYAEALSANRLMLSEIREAVRAGVFCYAECGGLMLLSEQLIDLEGNPFEMAGLVPGKVEMTLSRQNFGYCECTNHSEAPFACFRGHEFHHSRWMSEEKFANLWIVRGNRSGTERREGFRLGALHASYVHLYFPSSGELPLLQNSRREL